MKLKHLEHLEDYVFDGSAGIEHVFSVLKSMGDFMDGEFVAGDSLSVKYDGAPSVVFGVDPVTNKHFVGTKSVWNKKPKLNFSLDDLRVNHGLHPNVVAQLHTLLVNLPYIMKTKLVYQGDLMYTIYGVDWRDGRYAFTPNTITYSVLRGSEMGDRVAGSSLGIVVHTCYAGSSIENMEAGFNVDVSKEFVADSIVNVIDPQLQPGERRWKTELDETEFRTVLSKLKFIAALYGDSIMLFDHPVFHETVPLIKRYVNHTVRSAYKRTPAGFTKFLEGLQPKDAKTVKMKAEAGSMAVLYQNMLDDVFEVHDNIELVKDHLVHSLGNPTPFTHAINSETTGPEGFVFAHRGTASKLVNRHEFSRQNFANTKWTSA